MTFHPADAAIFLAFFALSIIVGFKHRGEKLTFREYAIGDKKFSTPVLTATIVATWISGSCLFIVVEETYSRGLHYDLTLIIGWIILFLIIGQLIGPRMDKFLNNVSVPDALSKLYGKPVQVIAGISLVTKTIGTTALQFKVISKILETLFDYNGFEITAIVGIIIIFYSATGGVKAVTFTDVLQFFTFGMVLPVLAITIWNNIQDTSQVAHLLNTDPRFSFREIFRWSPSSMDMIILIIYYGFPGLAPQLFQRMVMARDVTQIKRSITYANIICLAISLCMMWIGILLLADRPGLDPKQVIRYMVEHHTYAGLRGLLGIGVVALAMSTADSALNAGAVIFANDVLAPLRGKKEGSVMVARWATLGIGFLGLLLVLLIQSLLSILLLSASLYIPLAAVPMLLTIFGFQTRRLVLLSGMGAAFVTVVACITYFPNVKSFFPGIFANLFVTLAMHYLLGKEKGWGHNSPRKHGFYTHQPVSWGEWLQALKQFRLMPYLDQALPTQEYYYSLFGFYIFTASYASLYLLPAGVMAQYPISYRLVQYTITALTTTYMAFPIWPKQLHRKRFLACVWPMSVFYALFFVGSAVLVMSGFAITQWLILAMHFFMAALLLRWPVAVALAAVGTPLSVWLFQRLTGTVALPGSVSTVQFGIVYGLMLGSSFLIALFKHREAYKRLHTRATLLHTEHESTRQELVRALHHEDRFFSEINAMGKDRLEAVCSHIEAYEKEPTADMLLETKHKMQDMMVYLRNIRYRAQSHRLLKVDATSVNALLIKALDAAKSLAKLFTNAELAATVKNCLPRDPATLQGDLQQLQQLVVRALLRAHTHNPDNKLILLEIRPTLLAYPLVSLTDIVKKIDALSITVTLESTAPEVKSLYPGYMGGDAFQLPSSAGELDLIENIHIVKAHYGATDFRKGPSGLVQRYIIPQRLRQVRPKVMDLPEMEIGALKDAPQATLPEEMALLDKIEHKTRLDVGLAKKAIDTIKIYHAGAKRNTGELFYLHPIAATEILLSYSKDPESILATLLHDTVEDTPLTLAEIGILFGTNVAKLVDKVTNLDVHDQRISYSSPESLYQTLSTKDDRAVLIRIADRLHNMRTLHGHPSTYKRESIAFETLEVYIPLCQYFGLDHVEEELTEIIKKVMKVMVG